MTRADRLEVGIVGGGAVATAFARALAASGDDVLVWARHPDAVDVERVTDDLALAAARPTILVAVSDDAISEVAQRLGPALSHDAPVVLHTSGATTGSASLAALGGAAIRGSLHPLVAVPRDAAPSVFAGMPFVVEAESDDGVRRAESIVAAVGGELVRLPVGASKARYHALATMVATGVVTLVDRAARGLATNDEERAALRSAFARLAQTAAANAAASDGAEVLTGPIARGDASTLARHADALDGSDARALYDAVRRAAEAMLEGDA